MPDATDLVHKLTAALRPVVLDSPHSGFFFPADFGAAVGACARTATRRSAGRRAA